MGIGNSRGNAVGAGKHYGMNEKKRTRLMGESAGVDIYLILYTYV